MAQILYDFINSQYFGVIAIIWIFIDLGWISRWQALLKRIGNLISKPYIFEKDEDPENPSKLYPRRFLEQLALINKKSETDKDKEISKKSKEEEKSYIASQKENLFNPEKPIRTLGYIVALAFFAFFILADTITIANTMHLMGLVGVLSPLLQRLDLAILGGALFSVVVGVWMLIEMSGDEGEGELVNLDNLNVSQKRIYKIIAVIVLFISVLVLIALAIERLIKLGMLESTPTMEIILSFILYGLLAVNNSASAALTFSPAIAGLMTLIFITVLLIVSILPLFIFLLDVFWRTAFIVLDIIIWAIFTPIIVIPYAIKNIKI